MTGSDDLSAGSWELVGSGITRPADGEQIYSQFETIGGKAFLRVVARTPQLP